MGPTIRVTDGTTAGAREHERAVSLPAERVSVRQLIESRVYQEVTEFNAARSDRYRGLVQPVAAEEELNPPRRAIDWRAQADVAIEAFERGHLLVVVDDRQVEELDREVEVDTSTEVTFLRLVPLVGG
jgi:hypothetical protein